MACILSFGKANIIANINYNLGCKVSIKFSIIDIKVSNYNSVKNNYSLETVEIEIYCLDISFFLILIDLIKYFFVFLFYINKIYLKNLSEPKNKIKTKNE